jgi:PAS domain S-box-containing protein
MMLDASRSSERMAELLIQQVQDYAVFLMDENGVITDWGIGAERMKRWTADEAVGQHLRLLYPEQGASEDGTVEEHLAHAREHGEYHGEGYRMRRGTEPFWASVVLTALYEDRKLIGFGCVTRDLSDRRRIEQERARLMSALEHEHLFLQGVVEQTPDGIVLAMAPSGGLGLVNAHARELLRETEGIDGVAAYVRWGWRHGKDLPLRSEEYPLARALQGERVPAEEYLSWPDGAERSLWVGAAPIRDREGRILGAVQAIHDITEEKRTEEGLRRAQKLESIGLLAGGIAHDFNNLLTTILGNASLMRSSLARGGGERGDNGEVESLLDEVVHASERAAYLTRQLLAHAGKGRLQMETIDVPRAVAETVERLTATLPPQVELIADVARDCPPIRADRGQFQQALMNLVFNGAEALGGAAGTVRIEVRDESMTGEHLEREFHDFALTPGPYVWLRVTDTGSGIAPEAKAKIFDPFFTTKFLGRGLGLSAVLGIVRSHEAGMRVDTVPGRGTVFSILWPVIPPATPVASEEAATTRLRGSGYVLAVDDEDHMRRYLHNVLSRYGYRVLLATDGWEAVRLLEGAEHPIRLLLLDLTMPVITGAAALLEVRWRWPELPVLLMSGFGEHGATRQVGELAGAGIIAKPFLPEELAAQVQALLARTPQSERHAPGT